MCCPAAPQQPSRRAHAPPRQRTITKGCKRLAPVQLGSLPKAAPGGDRRRQWVFLQRGLSLWPLPAPSRGKPIRDTSVTDGEVISYRRLKTGFHSNLLHHLFLVFIMENFQTHMKIQDHVIEPMIYLDPRIIYDGANLVPSIPTHLDYLEAKLTYAIISSINTSVYTASLEESKRITIPSTHLNF